MTTEQSKKYSWRHGAIVKLEGGGAAIRGKEATVVRPEGDASPADTGVAQIRLTGSGNYYTVPVEWLIYLLG